MCGRNLCSDPGLPFWNDRKRKWDNVNAFLQQRFCHLNRRVRITEHNGNDRMLAWQHVETNASDLLSEVTSVIHQLVAELGRLRQEINCSDGRTDDRWRN